MHPAGHHEETFSRHVALSWANAYSRPVAKGGEDSQALREIAAKLIEIAAKLISMAVRGDLQAMKEIADRIEGKVPQAQIIQGDDDGGPIRLFATVSCKSATSEQWLEDIGRRPKLIDVVAREKAE